VRGVHARGALHAGVRAGAAGIEAEQAEPEAVRVESEQTEQAVRAESMRAARLVLESEQAREDSVIKLLQQ
jgi:hypothetical protein